MGRIGAYLRTIGRIAARDVMRIVRNPVAAVILAGVGVGVYRDFEEAVRTAVTVKRRHTPDPEVKEVYDKNYGIYLELYQNLRETMKK